MAIAFVQDDVGSPGDGGTLAFGSNVSAGSALVALIGFISETSDVNGITDTLSNTWAQVTRIADGSRAVEIWAALSPGAGACTLTFDWSAAVTPQVCIAEFSGFTNGISIDQLGENSTSGVTNHPHAAPAITTTIAATLAVSTGRFGGAFDVSAVNDSFTALTYQSRTIQHYRILASTATFDADIDTLAAESLTATVATLYETVASDTPLRWAPQFPDQLRRAGRMTTSGAVHPRRPTGQRGGLTHAPRAA